MNADEITRRTGLTPELVTYLWAISLRHLRHAL